MQILKNVLKSLMTCFDLKKKENWTSTADFLEQPKHFQELREMFKNVKTCPFDNFW